MLSSLSEDKATSDKNGFLLPSEKVYMCSCMYVKAQGLIWRII